MKTVMQLLSLLLCFEFIVAPVQGSLLINSAMADDSKSCPAGQRYESSVNRCLTKVEVLKVNEATQSCGGDKACYSDNAKRALGDEGMETSGKVTSGLETAVNAAAVAIPLVIVTSVLLEKRASQSGAGFSCKPASLILMYGAAAALAVGEIYGYYNHKSRLKKIQEKWDSSVVPKEESGTDKKRTEATEAQSQAFEFLAQNEEQVGKTAKTKKGFYLAATGMFAAGAAMAAVEMFQLSSARALLKTAQLRLATDSTAEADIQKHTQTIKRLTCYQEETRTADQKTEDDRKHKEQGEKHAAEFKRMGEEFDPKLEETSKAFKEAATIKPHSLTKESVLTQKTELYKKPEFKPIEVKKIEFNKTPNFKQDIKFEKIELKKPQSWIPNDKMKRVAAYNLSTAKDADQFLNLMREYDSIEFENYSQVRYEEADKNLQDLKFTPYIAKMIAETLVPQAQAGDEVKSLVTSLAPTLLLPMLGGVTKIFKFNGGKPMATDEMNAIKTRSSNFVIRAIGKPVTRLAINGVLGGWMGYMTANMNKQQKLAQERAKKLRSMKEDFISANGLLYCTEEDRSDTTKPKCYCFTPDNKVNPSRSSSEVCKNALATIKDQADDLLPDKVCVTSSMAMDSTCACRSTNTCLKTTAGFTSMGFSPATFRMISANAGAANDLFNGNASGADIADSAGINAARTQAAAANAIAGDKTAVKEVKNAADTFAKGLLATTSGLSMGAGTGSSPLPTTPAGAAAALDKEIKESSEDIDVTTSGKSSSPSANLNSTEEIPEFGMSSEEAAIQEIEIAEVMGKEVDFGSNDINKTKDTNLFEVLSNRYKRSGMKRLFEEEGKSAPADAPAKSDISN